MSRAGWLLVAALIGLFGAPTLATELAEQRQQLFDELQRVHGLDPGQMAAVRAVFDGSGILGQGNPAIVEHPMTSAQCQARRAAGSADQEDAGFARVCGARFMAPLYDPATEGPEDAKACIDQFEFPNIPCAYPVVWVRASEAAALCQAVGKRLCDAHEWEGACAGSLEPADYRFDLAAGVPANEAVERMRKAHNQAHSAGRRWSYGPDYQAGVCAAGSHKSAGCDGGGWERCGSNTYPAGAFPDCRSPLGVNDLNGNAAEHMNLPLEPAQMASRGSEVLGVTEMKGSWFIFDSYRAHDDWCRWRAPFWHGSRVLYPKSHANYHLGFRCCASLAE